MNEGVRGHAHFCPGDQRQPSMTDVGGEDTWVTTTQQGVERGLRRKKGWMGDFIGDAARKVFCALPEHAQ